MDRMNHAKMSAHLKKAGLMSAVSYILDRLACPTKMGSECLKSSALHHSKDIPFSDNGRMER
jgi:hypothetical protein